MVRIAKNGDIIPDDVDQSSRQRNTSTNTNRRQFGELRNDNAMGYQNQGAQQPSIFENFNRQLITNGFPRFQVGPWTVEPIASVGIILATLFLGFKGLLLGIFLFVIVNLSNSTNNGGGGGGHFSQIIASFFGGTPNNNNNNAANRR